MHPLWQIFIGAVLSQALLGPFVEAHARCAAGVGLLLIARRGRWSVLILGVLLGGIASVRLGDDAQRARAWPAGEGRAAFRLIDDARDGAADVWLLAAKRPPVRARLRGMENATNAGAYGIGPVRVWPVTARRNPDDRDARRAALGKQRLLGAKLLEREPILFDRPRGRMHFELRQRVASSVRERLGHGAGFWLALILGERSGIEDGVRRRFQRLGLAHLLALSGLHVGLIAGLVWLLLSRCFAPGSWWPLAPVILWALVAGLSPSLLRAVTMLIWVTAGRRSRRPARPQDALAAAGIVEIMARPWSLAGLSWWLSYAATMSLLLCAPLLLRVPRLLAAGAMSVAAQAATMPWVLSAFGALPWAAPLVHMLVGPAFALLMGAGFVLLIVGAALPGLADSSSALLLVLTHMFGAMMRGLDAVAPAPVGHPGINGVGWTAAMAISFLWLVPDLGISRRWRGGMTLLLFGLLHGSLLQAPSMRWLSLDVGQGDGGILRTGRTHWAAIDAGPAGWGRDAGERVLLPYLARRNARAVSLFITHGHLDHYGGSRALLESGRVRWLYLARCEREEAWAESIARDAAQAGTRLHWIAQGDSIRIGSQIVRCLWPPADAHELGENDRSLLLSVGPRGEGLVLTGDLERAGERLLLASAALPRARVLKLGHHGSDTATGSDFLAAISPEIGLVSCGIGNGYGHPHASTLELMEAAGVQLLRTDFEGAIEIRWGRRGVSVHPVRRPP